MIFLALLLTINFGCSSNDPEMPMEDLDFRQEMRDFVIDISTYSHSLAPNFIIIPQNGIALITSHGEPEDPRATAYLKAIDANAQEDLLYGYEDDDKRTPVDVTKELKSLLDISYAENKKILVVDYCWTSSKVIKSYAENNDSNYISFAAPSRELDKIPDTNTTLNNENSSNITSLKMAKNFLYLLNYDQFSTKNQLLTALSKTNYDLLILDAYYNEEIFTKEDVQQLKTKQNGGSRLVISYMSIGEAESYRYYWDSTWKKNTPDWLSNENPEWEGNYKVKYWNKDWQNIIYGAESSYTDKIIKCGFDGVYLDIIDAYEYYE